MRGKGGEGRGGGGERRGEEGNGRGRADGKVLEVRCSGSGYGP